MSARVFITGGSGLLGLSWALAVRDRCRVVLGLHERQVTLAGVSTHYASLDTVGEVALALDLLQPSLVVHTAGLANVDRCEADPALARHLNVELAANVAVACAKRRVRLIHVSTDHLFQGTVPLVEESHPVAPLNIYAATKAEAEGRVLAAHPDALVVRTNFYGWGPSYRSSFSDMIVHTLRRGESVTLFDDVFYTPILAESLSLIVHELVDLNVKGIVHVSGDERLSKYQFGLQIARQFDLDPALIHGGSIDATATLAPRPRDMSLSNARARHLLGRSLGGNEAQLARLRQQETTGHKQELMNL